MNFAHASYTYCVGDDRAPLVCSLSPGQSHPICTQVFIDDRLLETRHGPFTDLILGTNQELAGSSLNLLVSMYDFCSATNESSLRLSLLGGQGRLWPPALRFKLSEPKSVLLYAITVNLLSLKA